MKNKISLFDKFMMAMTFAEADEHETALQIMRKEPRPSSRRQLQCEETLSRPRCVNQPEK